MDVAPQIFNARVMHKRFFPRANAFTYRVWYVALPLPAAPLPSRFLSFRDEDHGAHDGTPCGDWATEILQSHGLHDDVARIVLVTMPRMLGYVFNPVSFFLCLDVHDGLRAVIAEVHNTFGERHAYLCARADHAAIGPDDVMTAEKLFHVSPFLPCEGSYRFRFALNGRSLGVWIDYHDAQGARQLTTSLTGTLSPLSRRSLLRTAATHPLITLRTIALIHWQALRLVLKGVRYLPKPLQKAERVSATQELTKM